MDFVGKLLGLLTFPMAVLTCAAIAAGLWLVVQGEPGIVALGLAMVIGATLVAPLLPSANCPLADWALASRNRGQGVQAIIAAGLSSATPLAVILLYEAVVFLLLLGQAPRPHMIALAIWSYGVATGPWSIQAARAAPRDRTLRGLQAYAAHLSYALLVLGAAWAHLSPAATAVLMLLPMSLPFTVGYLLALADRQALRDIQI